jgi:hypothetical protein
MDLPAIISQLGFPVAIAAFLIWQQSKATASMMARLAASEDFIRSTLAELNKETAQALRENTAAMREGARAHRDILLALRSRPCLSEPEPRPHPMPCPRPDTDAIHRSHA